MALLDGFIPLPPEPPPTNPHLTHGLNSFLFLDWPTRASIVTHDNVRAGMLQTSQLPVSTAPRVVPSKIPRSYYDDFYNRVHVIPGLLDMGNVVSTQVRIVDVWNAHPFAVNLVSLVSANTDGVQADGPTAPKPFAPMEMSTWDISVTVNGPPTINATFTWDFDVENPDPGVRIIGTRVILWQFEPDWQQPIIERLEWATDVLRSYNGREQRVQLRQAGPRASWEFSFNVHAQEANILHSINYEWQGRVFAMPVFPDGGRTTTSVSAGGSVVGVNTTTRDYRVGGLAVISAEGGLDYEAFEISAMTASQVTALRPLVKSWPAGSQIYPCRTARLSDSLRLSRPNASALLGVAQFQCVEPIARTAATEATYRSYPVLTVEPNWRDGLDYTYARELVTFDNLTNSSPLVDDPAPAIIRQAWLWTFYDRTEAEALRQWFYARKGRLKAIWVPTWANDLRIVGTLDSGSPTMDVEWCGLGRFVQAGIHRKDIRIELKNGTVMYRRVSNFIDAGTYDSMTLSSALGVTITNADVLRISWMMLARLDSDSVEIAWSNPAAGEAAFTLVGMNNDV